MFFSLYEKGTLDKPNAFEFSCGDDHIGYRFGDALFTVDSTHLEKFKAILVDGLKKFDAAKLLSFEHDTMLKELERAKEYEAMKES